ncbi:MAG: VanZ family protein [Candidatus Andersenbacteria bacterium]|nr:VanZ family protein [bacterium]MDZ4225254.1 VanZ family protein [Candidatus Andersenbacteria bacterium]
MRKSFWWVGVFLWAGIIWYWSSVPHLSSGFEYDFWLRKAAHMSEFFGLAALLFLAVGASRLRQIAAGLWLAVVYAGFDEAHQTLVAGRNGSWPDVAIDAAGVLLALLVLVICKRRRARKVI